VERIGLFGGSFNPVHLGHLLVAQAAREELQLTRLVFIPAAQSPFKPGVELAPAGARVRLLRLALAGWAGCVVDEQEVARGGISYTIETAQDYARRCPGAALFYLVGADQTALLPKWRQAPELAQLVEFAIIPRPGAPASLPPPPFRGRLLHGFPLAVSASQIRRRAD
jgi:nicotinate-nucleotide adenylyltransferase